MNRPALDNMSTCVEVTRRLYRRKARAVELNALCESTASTMGRFLTDMSRLLRVVQWPVTEPKVMLPEMKQLFFFFSLDIEPMAKEYMYANPAVPTSDAA